MPLLLACTGKTKESSVDLVKLFRRHAVGPNVAEGQGEVQATVKTWWPQVVSNSSATFFEVLKLLTDYKFDCNVAGETSATLSLEHED